MAPRDQKRERILILGAAGRDFHNFNTVFRHDPQSEVLAFTANQIPGIGDRRYPASLAGPLYPDGIQIYPEEDLEKLVKDLHVDRCILAYSDLSNQQVGEIMSRVLVAKADFGALCPDRTMLRSTKPVLAVTAVRTGCGKSQVGHYCIDILRKHKLKTVLVRHPMPYGDLEKEAVQRFGSYEDLKKQNVTIEEREEYEQHISNGTVVYAGVDYEAILRQAEKEADVVLWDGGNNDMPFYKPGLWICVADPLRLGHEETYYPGNLNFKCADVIDINKANTAPKENVEKLKEAAKARNTNPRLRVAVTDSEVGVDNPDIMKGKRVVTVDDGPTLTHGGMQFGAGKVAAEKYGAQLVDPREHFVGTLKSTLEKYPHIGSTIPAMGYSDEQIKDLTETINAVPADVVVIATPMDLSRLIKINKPTVRVEYFINERPDSPSKLSDAVEAFIKDHVSQHAGKAEE